MMERLKARRAEIARLREERGATDPILIIAGIAITLILLVGGSFAISGFIANAHNLNAQGDLERIATAQSAYLAQNDGFGALRVGPNVGTQNTQLQQGALGFTPTDGNSTIVRTAPAGWTAVTKSGSGAIYMRSSLSSDAFQASGGMVTDPAGYSAWAVNRTNQMVNPLGSTATGIAGYGVANGASVSFDAPTKGARVSAPANAFTDSGLNLSGAISYTPKASTFTVSMDVIGVTDGAWRISSQGTWAPTVVSGSYIAVAAGETKRVSMTFSTNTGARGALYLLRQNPGVASSAIVKNVMFEETDSAREFFDGSTPSSELVRNRWTGTPDASIAVLERRTIAAGTGQVWSPGVQPSGFTLPTGITWAQVAADIQDVNS
jgi:hypothetical protein